MIILSLLGAIYFGGNPFFVQKRVGKNNKVFSLIKFRSLKIAHTEAFSTYSKFLRTTHLDELPQLINILLNQMSIIGPRPLPPDYLPYYTQNEHKRHLVKPGIVGLSQLKGGNSLSWTNRLRYDSFYASKVSLSLDLYILNLSTKKLLSGKPTQHHFSTSLIEERKS
jgi:lipopolysaccharide/colanic/teichoic acid biosynthesis glycosyltransferase